MNTRRLTELQARVLAVIGADWLNFWNVYVNCKWGERGCSRTATALRRVITDLERRGCVEARGEGNEWEVRATRGGL
jgi:hypothetical protein